MVIGHRPVLSDKLSLAQSCSRGAGMGFQDDNFDVASSNVFPPSASTFWPQGPLVGTRAYVKQFNFTWKAMAIDDLGLKWCPLREAHPNHGSTFLLATWRQQGMPLAEGMVQSSKHWERSMRIEELRHGILDRPIIGSDGNHSARLWRVAENISDHLNRKPSDDRLPHLMSRIGNLSRGLARDLRGGHTTAQQAAILPEQLADLGDLSFKEWLQDG